MAHDEVDPAPVLLRTEGRAAYLTLNRPRAINALTHTMVRDLAAALDRFDDDPSVAVIVLTGAGERGLCAGGDIRAIRADAVAGGREALAFWHDEYRLNARIARLRTPYVAVMDGIVMGGGVGVSAHGSVRIVTERSAVGMPETGIGFVPDVGGTYLLARAPGELGTHLGLTGLPVGAGDAILCGLADHYVPSGDLAAFTAEPAGTDVRDAVLRYARPAPEGVLAAQRDWIDACYGAGSVEEIVHRLLTHGAPEAKEAAETILTRSPTSLKVTLTALRRARALDSLEEVLEQEYRVSCAVFGSPDLVEGIRAQVIDKDRRPRWSPARLEDVEEGAVARFFRAGSGSGLGLVGR
ncbi:enoyl-CoA hydratase/isomerase family protein [Streptomyces sp. NPDC094448]|uniref:enoyl-CoA hydratase/isomerase family protein n=1 Tax=Streptomyces sp. NPDC094448 TaxID=3366063 RepID=UPI0037FB599A